MQKFLGLILLSFSVSVAVPAQNASLTVEIAAVGDILLARGVEGQIEKYGTDYPFENVKHLLSSADLAFGNLENPLTDKCQRSEKKYSFQAKPEYTKILRSAGLDLLSLSNNHSLDCGSQGLLETIKNLDKENLAWFGAGKTEAEAESPIIVERKGITIAFLGFTAISPGKRPEGFSHISIATTDRVVRLVKKARRIADVVIVSFHWGTEYALRPNPEQITLAEAAVSAGADAVLGHHPHVLQQIEFIDKTIEKRRAIIAFSLGNFVFDSPVRLNNRLSESVILKMRFSKSGLVGTEIIPLTIEGYRPIVANDAEQQLIRTRLNYFSSDAQFFAKLIETDLDSDGTIESIDLNSGRDNALQIRHQKNQLWQGIPAIWKPWKLEIADVDGDGRKEIIVGVYKSTKFFPKPHNCLFVYGWDGERVFPKWLGSSLARVFTDFVFADLDGKAGDELIAMETTLEGKKSLAVYGWNGFGFTVSRQYGNWESARILGVKDGQISVEADGKRIFITNDTYEVRL